MKTYQSISVPVQAEQFEPSAGQTENLPHGIKAVEDRMGGLSYYVGMTQIVPGDWFVKTAEGEELIFPPDVFATTFEPKPE